MTRLALPRAAAVVALLLAAACHRLPPDPDGQPAGAQTLELGAAKSDQLNCDQGDCADWYAIDVPAKGKLDLDLTSDAATAPGVDFEMILYDAKGTALATERTGGKSAVELRANSVPATYYIAVGFAVDSQPTGTVIPYTLTAKNEVPPPPKPAEQKPKPTAKPAPKPVFETRRGSVLEIQDNGKSVLLDIGKSQGVRVGLRGRLIRGNATAGSLEITEVFPEGSLARVTGGKADADSVAEVDIPVGVKTP